MAFLHNLSKILAGFNGSISRGFLMGRQNKPWYRKDRIAWYATINGKMVKLGKDKEEAEQRFHELNAATPVLSEESLVVIIDELLTWTEKNRREGTFRFYKEHAQQFSDYLKHTKPPCFRGSSSSSKADKISGSFVSITIHYKKAICEFSLTPSAFIDSIQLLT